MKNRAKVFSLTKDEEVRLWSKVNKSSPDKCWEWIAAKTPGGYGKMMISERKMIVAHRGIWLSTYGELHPNLLVLHKCDNPSCCNPSHLFLGTDADNMRDKSAKGRDAYLFGRSNGNGKLSDEQISKIRKLSSSGKSIAFLADEYNVHPSHIWSILIGRRRQTTHK